MGQRGEGRVHWFFAGWVVRSSLRREGLRPGSQENSFSDGEKKGKLNVYRHHRVRLRVMDIGEKLEARKNRGVLAAGDLDEGGGVGESDRSLTVGI